MKLNHTTQEFIETCKLVKLKKVNVKQWNQFFSFLLVLCKSEIVNRLSNDNHL